MALPEKFIDEMDKLWQSYQPPGTLDDFIHAMEQPAARGLRANGLKLTPSRLAEQIGPYLKGQVAWSDDGFYLSADAEPGKMPAYHAGLFYIQEPSAMLPAQLLACQPGERVLDLCAAPGGKTARMAADLAGNGLLWSNEISADRARALLRNIELIGCTNSIVSQETPERLADRLPDFFDRILVDAPCSGSGMFRRDKSAAASWQKYGTDSCVILQQSILDAADGMLRPGGRLVYSTCSFSCAENETMIDQFLHNHPDYMVVPVPLDGGLSPGLSSPTQHDPEQVARTIRIWPHQANGDGHFCAVLQKTGVKKYSEPAVDWNKNSDRTAGHLDRNEAIQIWQDWLKQVASNRGLEKIRTLQADRTIRMQNQHLHLLPMGTPDLSGLKLLKTGWYLGSFSSKQKRNQKRPVWTFEPSHSWFLTLLSDDFRHSLRLTKSDDLLHRYLKGETLICEPDFLKLHNLTAAPGELVVICLEEFPLGPARMMAAGTMKNQYPQAWRKRS